MTLIQELDKLEEDGNVNAVFITNCALGDEVCVSGALNQYYNQYKQKLYIISSRPSLFAGQDYCKDAIDSNFLSADGREDQSNFFRKFKKIYTMFWQNESHLKGYNSLVENYCELLNVKKVKYPFFKIQQDNLFEKAKPYILVSLKKPNFSLPFIGSKNKYFTDKNNEIFFENLQNDFQNYQIIDLGKIKINGFHDMLKIVANCKTFLSVDTSLQHLAANQFKQRKGVVLWNNKNNISFFGYDYNINLSSDFVHPYDNYDIIVKNLKKILQNVCHT